MAIATLGTMSKQQSLLTLQAYTKMQSAPMNGSSTCNTLTVGGSTTTCLAELLKNQSSTPTSARTSPLEFGITGFARGIAVLLIICGRLLNALLNGCCQCVATMAPSCGPKKNMRARGTTRCSRVHQAFGMHSVAQCILRNSSTNQNRIGLPPPINCALSLQLALTLLNPKHAGRWTGTTPSSPTRWKVTKQRLDWLICGTPLQWKVAEFVASATNRG